MIKCKHLKWRCEMPHFSSPLSNFSPREEAVGGDVFILKYPVTLSIISGTLLALSYPQFNFWIIAWIALIPLFFAIEKMNIIQSFGLGWLTGFVMFIGQIFWLKVFHVSIPIIMSAYLGLYFGLFSLVLRK